MRKSLLFASAALLVMTNSSFAAPADQPGHTSPKPGSNTEAVSKVEDATAGVVGKVSAEMTSTTQGFVTAAAISDMYEVTAGKLALERSSSPAVKEFAQKMVDAHTETTTQLKRIERVSPRYLVYSPDVRPGEPSSQAPGQQIRQFTDGERRQRDSPKRPGLSDLQP